MKSIAFILAALAFTTCVCPCADETKFTFQKDVVYGKTGEENLLMDLATPSGNGPFPCIVCIHGGGWAHGSKNGYDGLIRKFAEHGYVAATVEYRFAPKFHFPAQIEDCKCAVRYLRSHARDLHIDKEKFGALGDSAGGHLSLLLGLMNKEDGLEGDGGNPDQPSKVQAVVNYYGPASFIEAGQFSVVAHAIVKDFLGTDDPASPLAKQASPNAYIDKSDAPVLTFHGSADPLVPVGLSKKLHEKLKAAGVEEKLEILDGKGHGWGGPDMEKTRVEALEFFDAHLKK